MVNGGSTSGGDQLTLELVNRVDFDGFDITWISSFEGCNFAKSGVNKDIRFKVIKGIIFKKNIWIQYIIRTLILCMHMIRKNYNILYVNSDFLPDVIPAFINKIIFNETVWIQCVFHIYPDYKIRPGNYLKNRISKFLQKLSFILINYSDFIHVINNDVKDFLIKTGIDKDKIILITPGIDIDYINKNSLDQTRVEHYDCIFLGRLSPSKGVHDLPQIWRLVVDSHPKARLAIIGGGNSVEIEKLNNEIRIHCLQKNIEIIGAVSNEEKYKLMGGCKIFIFPSHEEGFGIAIAEALCCGMNVVAWDLDVYRELYGKYINTAKYNDIKDFSNKIKYLMNESCKKNNSNIEYASKFSWNVIASQFDSFIKGV